MVKRMEELKKLQELRDKGLITEEEQESRRAEIIEVQILTIKDKFDWVQMPSAIFGDDVTQEEFIYVIKVLIADSGMDNLDGEVLGKYLYYVYDRGWPYTSADPPKN